MVSIGKKVSALLADPSSDEWKDYSIEFCGGVHVPSLAKAELFVVVEESGIAKGVRRVVALTKSLAAAAVARAAAFETKIAAAEAIAEAPAIEAAVKLLTPELNDLSISIGAKAGFRARLAALVDAVKAAKKIELKRRTELADKAAEAVPEGAGAGLAVARVDVGVDKDASKLIKKMTDKMVKANGKASYLVVSADPVADKFMLYATICKDHLAEGLDAKVLITKTMEAVKAEGRFGGKPAQATGTFPGAEKADGAGDFANEYTWKS